MPHNEKTTPTKNNRELPSSLSGPARNLFEKMEDALGTAIERYDCAGLTDLEEFKEIDEAYQAAGVFLERDKRKTDEERRKDIIRGYILSTLVSAAGSLRSDPGLRDSIRELLTDEELSFPSWLDEEISAEVRKIEDQIDDLAME